MIYSYSTLRGGGYSTLGSCLVHLSMFLSMWICLSHITDQEETIEALMRPRDLFLWCSAVHISVCVIQGLNWARHLCESVEMLQETLTVCTLWTMLFAVIALFSDYLHLVDEKEYKYLFERPYIWQEYAFWMLAEILIFISAILSNVLYLAGRQFSRNKLENTEVHKFAFYQWAGPEVIA